MPKKQALGAVLVGMIIHSSTAQACSFVSPTCVSESNGLVAERVDTLQESDNVAIFVERSADYTTLKRLFLVDCRSRMGVSADLPENADFQSPVVNWSIDYLIKAASSNRPYSLAEIKDQLSAEGLQAKVNKLPVGHCGCSLPEFEVPECPAELPLEIEGVDNDNG